MLNSANAPLPTSIMSAAMITLELRPSTLASGQREPGGQQRQQQQDGDAQRPGVHRERQHRGHAEQPPARRRPGQFVADNRAGDHPAVGLVQVGGLGQAGHAARSTVIISRRRSVRSTRTPRPAPRNSQGRALYGGDRCDRRRRAGELDRKQREGRQPDPVLEVRQEPRRPVTRERRPPSARQRDHPSITDEPATSGTSPSRRTLQK
jgi:hypothetical protein